MHQVFRFCLLAAALLPAASALGQPARWAQSINGPNNESAGSVAVDAAGNTYVGGSFQSTTTIGTTTLTAAGATSTGAFLVQYSPTGALNWVRPLIVNTSRGDLHISSLAVDASGAVLLTGYYDSGALPIGNITLPANSSGLPGYQGFVAKINSQGTTLWANAIPVTSASVYPTAIATDAAGAVYIAGDVGGSVPFVAKYSSAGVSQFMLNAPGTSGQCTIWGLAVSPNGQQMAMVGTARAGTLTLAAATGGRPAVEVFSPTTAGEVGFVAGISATGVAQWAHSLDAGLRFGNLFRVAAAGSDFVVCGYFSATATFGSAPAYPLSTTGTLYSSMVARLGANGTIQWVQSFGGNQNVLAFDIALDGAGNVHVGGTFSGQLNASGRNLVSAGQTDLFFLTYSDQGALRGGQRDGGAAYDDLFAFALDAANQPHAVGRYIAGPTSLAGVTLPVAQQSDGFIIKVAATPLAARTALLAPAALTAVPNPAHAGDTWQVVLDAKLSTAPATLRVVNILGQEVRRQPLPAGSATAIVPTTGLPSGRYVLQVTGATAVATRAVVLE